MRAGSLDHLLTLKRPCKNVSASGQRVTSKYELAGTYRAECPKRGVSVITDGGELFEQHRATFLLRWGVTVERGWRVEEGGIVYKVDTVQRHRRSGIVEITCVEVNT